MGVLLWILLSPSMGFFSICVAVLFGPLWYILMLSVIFALYKIHRERPHEAFDDRRFLTGEEIGKVVTRIFAKPEHDD